jgi:hypothetical protein
MINNHPPVLQEIHEVLDYQKQKGMFPRLHNDTVFAGRSWHMLEGGRGEVKLI